jgi:hypothetical protein
MTAKSYSPSGASKRSAIRAAVRAALAKGKQPYTDSAGNLCLDLHVRGRLRHIVCDERDLGTR